MEQFNLAYYLEDFRRLAELEEADLQALLSRYPYAQNLHLLKSKWDWTNKHMFSEGNAVYATHRERFFQQIESEAWEQFPDFIFPKHISEAIIPPINLETENLPILNTSTPPQVETIDQPDFTLKPEVAPEPVELPEPNTDPTESAAVPADQTSRPDFIEKLASEGSEVGELPVEPIHEETQVSGSDEESSDYPEEEYSEAWSEIAPPLPSDADEVKESLETVLPAPANIREDVWDLLEEPWTEKAVRHTPEQEPESAIPINDPELPLPGNAYSQWLQRLSPVTPGLVQTYRSQSAADVEVTDTISSGLTQQIKDASSASNIMRDHIASETLADILARQGYKERAISIYEKLILTNPEKSNFFAEKIKKLKGL